MTPPPIFRYTYRDGLYTIAFQITPYHWQSTTPPIRTLRHCAPKKVCDMMEIKVRLGDPAPVVYFRGNEFVVEELLDEEVHRCAMER